MFLPLLEQVEYDDGTVKREENALDGKVVHRSVEEKTVSRFVTDAHTVR